MWISGCYYLQKSDMLLRVFVKFRQTVVFCNVKWKNLQIQSNNQVNVCMCETEFLKFIFRLWDQEWATKAHPQWVWGNHIWWVVDWHSDVSRLGLALFESNLHMAAVFCLFRLWDAFVFKNDCKADVEGHYFTFLASFSTSDEIPYSLL